MQILNRRRYDQEPLPLILGGVVKSSMEKLVHFNELSKKVKWKISEQVFFLIFLLTSFGNEYKELLALSRLFLLEEKKNRNVPLEKTQV